MIKFKNILLLSALIFCSKIYSQQFPINFDSDSLKIAKSNLEAWNGKIIATQCNITQIEKGYKNKPYYKCNITENEFLWVGSLMNDTNRIKLNEKIRIIGFFSKTENDDKISQKFNEQNFNLLAFGILNITNKKAYILPGTENQFNDWKNGIIEQEK